VGIAADEFDRLIEFALQEAVDLVVVGPDDPLAAGIVDRMEAAGLRVFGPTRAQARIESSKAHAKEFLRAEGIATARYAVAETLAAAREIIAANPWARVVKADGLALGKGVFVCEDEQAARAAAEEIFAGGKFGEAGRRVVIEERLAGEEMSLLALCDGSLLVPFIACQDHKRRFDGDRGPNTGGMGVYAPVPLYERARASIESEILAPLEQALAAGRLSHRFDCGGKRQQGEPAGPRVQRPLRRPGNTGAPAVTRKRSPAGALVVHGRQPGGVPDSLLERRLLLRGGGSTNLSRPALPRLPD
jgi:phosphoribosylamine--glycine ligase